MPQCSVPGCTKQGGHKFPFRNEKLLKEWLIAVRREDPVRKGKLWKPGPSARVCSDHFHDSDYVTSNYYGNMPGKKQLKKDAVPHVFPKVRSGQLTALSGRSIRAKKKAEMNEKILEEAQLAWREVGREEELALPQEHEHEDAEEGPRHPPVSVAVQTEGSSGRQLYRAKDFSDENLHFYTGLETYEKFLMVLSTLGDNAYSLNYYYGMSPPISVEDQFFLTLIKFRTHPTNKEIGIFFGLNEKQVSNIFITWVNFLYCQWSEINWWPTRELVQFYTPTDFCSKFPGTRCIFDGTECPIKKPKQPVAQQATFSSYKNRNTMKVLVGASPGGLVTYISPAYAGSTSDRQIVERSNIPQLCDPGDQIMADKGFNVEDMFIPFQVSVNIPTFFKKKNRMSNETVQKDRKIASKRVHIERIIGLAKTYKILRDPMINFESSLASRIVKVIFLLCNFRRCIVPENA